MWIGIIHQLPALAEVVEEEITFLKSFHRLNLNITKSSWMIMSNRSSPKRFQTTKKAVWRKSMHLSHRVWDTAKFQNSGIMLRKILNFQSRISYKNTKWNSAAKESKRSNLLAIHFWCAWSNTESSSRAHLTKFTLSFKSVISGLSNKMEIL